VDKESDSTGVVIEVGDGIRLKNGNIIPLSVAVGDRVVFRKDTGVAMGIDGESVIIIRESELFGVLEK
jgi:chaperonin GroES